MIYVLYTLFILSCVVLITSVLLQPGKSDAGALFTSSVSSNAFGPRGTQTILAKITIGAAFSFMLFAFMLSQPFVTGQRSVLETTGAVTTEQNTNANTGANTNTADANANTTANSNVTTDANTAANSNANASTITANTANTAASNANANTKANTTSQNKPANTKK